MQVEGFSAAESLPADVGFMKLALAAASDAGRIGEVPIGAVVVIRGEILARAHNAPIVLSDPTAHAESI